MDIKQTDDSKEGRFFIEVDNKQVAKMTYVWSGDSKIVIEHTVVDESLRGNGTGKQMFEKAVEFARSKNIKIEPVCPFVKTLFEKTDEYNDVKA